MGSAFSPTRRHKDFLDALATSRRMKVGTVVYQLVLRRMGRPLVDRERAELVLRDCRILTRFDDDMTKDLERQMSLAGIESFAHAMFCVIEEAIERGETL